MITQQDKFVRIAALMSATFERELSELERAELDGLLNTPQLRQMAEEWEHNPSNGIERYAKYSAVQAFRQFKKRTKKRPQRRIIWGAAALAALVVGSGLLLRRNSFDRPAPITAATEHATLYTEWGDVVELGKRDTTINFASVSGSNISFAQDNPDNSLSEGASPRAAASANRVVVPRGGIFFVTLHDGTNVALNAGSELSFPSSFEGADERRVALRGEGYFEVAKDASKPFIVTTPEGLDVSVLGTRFNVQAYADDPQTQVTLLQGSVGVHHGTHRVVLDNGWQAVFDRTSGAMTTRHAENAAGTMAWSQGVFYFDAAPLSEIIASLERWYDVDFDTTGVDIAAEGLFSMRINCTADLNDILEMLHDVTGLSHTIKMRKVTITQTK